MNSDRSSVLSSPLKPLHRCKTAFLELYVFVTNIYVLSIFRDLKMENILLDDKHKNLKVIGK